MANKASAYLVDVSKEMKKVHWPSRNELVSNTILTLIAALILAGYIYVADQVISRILNFVFTGEF